VAAHTGLQCKAKPIIACFLPSVQTTAVATEAQDTFPMHLTYYAGLEARADMVFASGSLKVTTSNCVTTLFSDASTVNVVIASEHVAKGLVDPASDATCVIIQRVFACAWSPGIEVSHSAIYGSEVELPVALLGQPSLG